MLRVLATHELLHARVAMLAIALPVVSTCLYLTASAAARCCPLHVGLMPQVLWPHTSLTDLIEQARCMSCNRIPKIPFTTSETSAVCFSMCTLPWRCPEIPTVATSP